MEEANPDSVLNYFRRMISIRKESEVLKYGTLELVETGDSPLFIFHRISGDEKWMIILNFSSQSVKLPLDGISNIELIISNYEISAGVEVRPWEAAVYKSKAEAKAK